MTRRTSQQVENSETAGDGEATPNIRTPHERPPEDQANGSFPTATLVTSDFCATRA